MSRLVGLNKDLENIEFCFTSQRDRRRNTIKVIIEVTSWLKEDFGHDGLNNLVIEEVISQGTSIMDLIHLIADKYPKFGKKALADQKQNLLDYLLVILNGSIVSTPAALNTELKEGDKVTLTPAFYGG